MADNNAAFRDKFKKKGKGGPPAKGKGFAIENEAQLKEAIKRAEKLPFTRGFVKKRAAALKLSNLIPKSW